MNKHIKILLISMILSVLIYRTPAWQILACTSLFFIATEVYLFLINFCKKRKMNQVKEDIFDSLKR